MEKITYRETENKMNLTCSTRAIKYLMFIFNFFFVVRISKISFISSKIIILLPVQAVSYHFQKIVLQTLVLSKFPSNIF